MVPSGRRRRGSQLYETPCTDIFTAAWPHPSLHVARTTSGACCLTCSTCIVYSLAGHAHSLCCLVQDFATHYRRRWALSSPYIGFITIVGPKFDGLEDSLREVSKCQLSFYWHDSRIKSTY
ncbi:hypothetical protein HanRHA438_Chr00c22g0852761 [Helianthus annuus]|nr:hypothetical protein HanRHA438_Chr00c22g0852761 [Helianthus annuus]